MKTKNYMLLIVVGLTFQLMAQDKSGQGSSVAHPVMDVYINCISCDFQYLKENMSYLNFSREPETADVYIIVTSLPTGSGGEEFLMELAGRQRFAAIHDTLRFTTGADMTRSGIRNLMLDRLKTALVPFLLKTSFADNITVSFDKTNESYQNDETDKWRNWLFAIGFSGSVHEEKSFSHLSVNPSIDVSKITPDIKIEMASHVDFNRNTYRFWENDSLVDSFVSAMKDFGLSGLIVKSAGDHAGIGGLVSVKSSLFYNLKKQIIVAPAFEYNLYKYKEASRKQLVIRYIAGYEHSDYVAPTIEGNLHNRLFWHEMTIGFSVVEKFGTIDATIRGSNYLHDVSCYDLGAGFMADINICKGFSVITNFNVEYRRNQISLQGGNLSPESQLLGIQEMETEFSFNAGIGFSFRFGSINNNTVNPRFDL